MTFGESIEQAIRAEANKLAERHQRYHNNLQLAHERDKKRITNPPEKEVLTPAAWQQDKKFNPFYVLKHSKSIARSISNKLQAGTYLPMAPFVQQVAKKGGGTRQVMMYQIPDAAVSTYFYEKLLKKNIHRFSSFAYAYRQDRNVHFAIQDIAVDMRYYSRLFIAEVDFSDFFGSINHTFLYEQFDQNGFLIAEGERAVIRGFAELNGAAVGIPQGTSISLFLANLACWKLDKQLEAIGVKFARYADDTLIWSNDYSKICEAFEVIQQFSTSTGVPINFSKSEGISLLTHKELRAELGHHKHSLDFLGYTLAVDHVSIKKSAVQKIKKQISYLLYKNLIQPLRGQQLCALVIPANNRDDALVVAMSQIRRYLYGDLTEYHLQRYLRGYHYRVAFKGVMSFYPLVDDEAQLREMDAWLVGTLFRCLRFRARLLNHWGHPRFDQFPFNVPHNRMVPEFRKVRTGQKRLLTIPSFLRIYRALKRGLVMSGIEGTMNPGSNTYHYEDE
jgi:RNA-directed DNA polymerase